MNNNSKSWISCMVILVILGIVLTVMRWFGWLLFPLIIIIDIVRSLLWQRKMSRMQHDEPQSQNDSEDHSKYCEAEFEVLDDEDSGQN